MLKIGSSTVPTVFESGRPLLMAIGERTPLPRPRKRARSVSNCRSPTASPSTTARCAAQISGSSGDRVFGASPAARRARHEFRLDEQLGKCRMRRIVGSRAPRRPRNRKSARSRAYAAPRLEIDTRRTSAVVLRRHDDIESRREGSVAPHDFGAILRETRRHSCPAWRRSADSPPTTPRRLSTSRKINIRSPRIAGDILAPTRDGKIAPAAVARSGGGDHDGVAAVRQKMRARDAIVRRVEPAQHRRQRVRATCVDLAHFLGAHPFDTRHRAAASPAAKAPSPGRSDRHESASASSRREAYWRSRSGSFPGGAPYRRARRRHSCPPEAAPACSPAPHTSRNGRVRPLRPDARNCAPRRWVRPSTQAPSHRARRRCSR